MNCMSKTSGERETLEILVDVELVKSLKRAEADIKAGRIHSHKDVFAIKGN